MGHDICVNYDNSGDMAINCVPGKVFPGGPTYMFREKEVPALIICTPKSSITSEILKKAFKRLDNLNMYPRTASLTPMVLFDAHDSQLQVPFLRYIKNSEHLWKACIGLPNGTYKWQVGDAKEQNGNYEIFWVREKNKLVLYRICMGLDSNLERNDILPLLNLAWKKSFDNVWTNKRAIWDRGWYPEKRRLLTDSEILKTRTSTAVETSTALVCVTDSSSTNTPPVIHLLPMPPLPMIPTIPPLIAYPRNTAYIVTVSGDASTYLSTIKTNPVELSPWIDLENINFAQGLAGYFTIDIIQHLVKKEKVGQNLNKRYKQGTLVQEEIDKSRRLTGGGLFKARHIILDINVLEIREKKEKEKADEKEKMVQGAILKYNKWKMAYDNIMQSGMEEKDYKSLQFKSIINFKKRKLDKVVPTKAENLKIRCEEAKQQNVVTVREYLTDRGLFQKGQPYLEIVDKLILAQLAAKKRNALIATVELERNDRDTAEEALHMDTYV